MCGCHDHTGPVFSKNEFIASQVQHKKPKQNDEIGFYLASCLVKGCLSEIQCCVIVEERESIIF